MTVISIVLRDGVSTPATARRIRAVEPDADIEQLSRSLVITTRRPGSILRHCQNLLNDSRWVNVNMETDK